MDFNRDKFKSLVQYICFRADREELGAVKLNKILWLSDFVYFVLKGSSITGEVYRKQQLGPVAYHIIPILQELQKENKIVVRTVPHYGYEKTEYIAPRDADISDFSAEEISLIDQNIHFVCHENTARSISGLSHNVIWEIAEIGEELPYETAFAVGMGELTGDDIQWAKENIRI